MPEATPDIAGSTVARDDTCMLVSPTPDASPPRIREIIRKKTEWELLKSKNNKLAPAIIANERNMIFFAPHL